MITIVYFINLGFTIHGVSNGSLVFGKTQVEIEDGMLKKAQDAMGDEVKNEV